MLILDLSPAYYAPVSFPVLNAEGLRIEIKFDAQFKRHTDSEIQALMANKSLATRDAVRTVMMGWKLVKTKDGVHAPFTDDNFNELLNTPGAANAIWEAFLLSAYKPSSAISALADEAAEKN